MKELLIPIIITVISTVVGASILGMVKGFINHMKGQIRTVLAEIELIQIEIYSIDSALELSLQNGYKTYKQNKKQELLQDSKFITNKSQ